MKLTKDVLNVGLALSLEFGENWLVAIDDRLTARYSGLTKLEVRECDTICKQVSRMAHNFVRENPIKNSTKVEFVDFIVFRKFMIETYDWIHDANLNKLYSQSCYYALK